MPKSTQQKIEKLKKEIKRINLFRDYINSKKTK